MCGEEDMWLTLLVRRLGCRGWLGCPLRAWTECRRSCRQLLGQLEELDQLEELGQPEELEEPGELDQPGELDALERPEKGKVPGVPVQRERLPRGRGWRKSSY